MSYRLLNTDEMIDDLRGPSLIPMETSVHH